MQTLFDDKLILAGSNVVKHTKYIICQLIAVIITYSEVLINFENCYLQISV